MNYKIIEIDDMIFKIKKNLPSEKIEPIFELYRGKLFTYLNKLFTNDCLNTFGTFIFSIKKSFSRTLNNLLASWIFSLYIDYDFGSDYFFPSNFNNTKIIEDTLKDFCKYDDKITNIDEKINKITTNLKLNYKNQLSLLNEYKKSKLFHNNKNNYRIKKTLVTFKKNKVKNETLFYKFEINVPFQIKDKRLINIINNILLPTKNYDKLCNNYSGSKNMMDDYIWAIIFRYQLLGSNNHQLAVLPHIMLEMKKDYNLNFECFASAINSTFPNYCSIYYDIEKFFGSVGSFFNIIPLKGTFGFNPPYQKEVIEIGIQKLFIHLEESQHNLTFIITIPIWDISGREYMKNNYNNELEKQNIDYGEFEIINKIKESKYFKALRMIAKEKFTYIDYNFELYKNKTIQNTYVIILSNDDDITDNKLNEYVFELSNEEPTLETSIEV